MSYANALEYIESKIGEERKRLVDHIAQGTLKSHEEYHKICGIIQGLDAVDNLIRDLAKRMEQDDE